MEIEERISGGVAILDLKGRLVLEDGEEAFRQRVDALIARGHTSILANFDGVTLLERAGVGAVVWKYVTVQRHGGVLKLLHLKPRSHKVLAITRLLTVLEAFESEAEAVASFAAGGATPSPV